MVVWQRASLGAVRLTEPSLYLHKCKVQALPSGQRMECALPPPAIQPIDEETLILLHWTAESAIIDSER